MIGAGLLLCASFGWGQAPQEDAVRVSVEAPERAVLRDEPLPVSVRLRVDADFLRERMLQPFRRAIECPVQLEVPWLRASPDWLVREAAAPPEQPAWRLVLNGALVAADAVEEVRDGERRWLTFTVTRTVLARSAGEHAFPAPRADYAWTPAFTTDLFGAPIPSERRDAVALGEPFVLAVHDWPAAQRPADFSGSVGNLSLRVAHASDGGSGRIVMRLWLEGDGNWEHWSAPALETLPGLHLLGRTERRSAGVLEVRAEFEPGDPAPREFPALAYPYLDPGPPPSYRLARSAPVALPQDAESAPPPIAQEAPAPRDVPKILLALSAVVALGALALGLMARARWRAGAEALAARPDSQPGHDATPRTTRQPGEPAPDPAIVYTEYLAARFRVPAASLHDPGLAQRLQAQGCPQEAAVRAAELFERLQATRYGGQPWPEAESAVRSAMAELRSTAPERAGSDSSS